MSPNITFDIQVEIIKRLPVKSLFHFRSVCKAWKSLIDSSQFIAGYSVPHTQPQQLLISYKDGYESEVKCVFFVDDHTFPQQKFVQTVPPLVQLLNGLKILGSSHGLLCFFGFLKEEDNSRPTRRVLDRVVLWNPSIRKSVSVAVPNVYYSPFESVVGFGVYPATRDPTLVKITFYNATEQMKSTRFMPIQVEVFRLSSSEWTIPCSNLPRKSIVFTWSQVVIGQFIYWLVYERNADVDGFGYDNLIMSFDMGTEEFREIDLPDCLVRESANMMSISKLRESLVVLEYYTNITSNLVCDVWMMDHGDPKTFTNLFTIKVPSTSIRRTLGFSKSGKPIMVILDDYYPHYAPPDFDDTPMLVVYEPWSQRIENLGFGGDQNTSVVNSYMESLLLLNHADYV